MAIQIVTIRLNANNQPYADPDPVPVNPGDIIIWMLAPGLHWPPNLNPASIIQYLSGTNLIVPGSLQFVIAGMVRSDAAPLVEENYGVNVSTTIGTEEVMLSTHDDTLVDPKIKVNPH